MEYINDLLNIYSNNNTKLSIIKKVNKQEIYVTYRKIKFRIILTDIPIINCMTNVR